LKEKSMKNPCLLISCLLIFFLALPAKAQYYYYNTRFYEQPLSLEVAASAAGMNCLTDIGKRRRGFPLGDVDWKSTRPGFALSSSLLYQNKIGCRLQTSYGKLMAYDSMPGNRKRAPERFERRLQFETVILEAVLLAEVYPLTLLSAGEHPVFFLSPYLLAGIGYFNFNPVARIASAEVRLHPLHTEGQGFPEHPDRKPYALNQWNLPFGLGLRYEWSAMIVSSIELLYRKLFTDYLDDVSKDYIDPALFYKHLPAKQATLASGLSNRQLNGSAGDHAGKIRGNPGNKDAYLSFNLKMAVALGRERR
jgi:hypothetical protein